MVTRTLAVALIVAGMFFPIHRNVNVKLTSGDLNASSMFLADVKNPVVLVLGPSGIPTPSRAYLDSVQRIYLSPLGYTGSNLVALTTPEEMSHTASGLAQDEDILFRAAMDQINSGHTVLVFGYSQSSAAASTVERRLAKAGVTPNSARFILVGDSGSQYGIINRMIGSLPEGLRDWAIQQLPDWDLQGVVTLPGQPSDAITPTDAFPTAVFTLPHDGYAEWPEDAVADPQQTLQAIAGLFTTHMEYMGLTPEHIVASFDNPDIQGLTTYYTIPDGDINMFDVLINAGKNVGWL